MMQAMPPTTGRGQFVRGGSDRRLDVSLHSHSLGTFLNVETFRRADYTSRTEVCQGRIV